MGAWMCGVWTLGSVSALVRLRATPGFVVVLVLELESRFKLTALVDAFNCGQASNCTGLGVKDSMYVYAV